MHQVPWTNKLTESFIEKGALSEDEAYIMRTRVKGYTVSKQAMELNCSEATVHRMISLLKKKYDKVRMEYPNEFPKRRTSAKETWMDEH